LGKFLNRGPPPGYIGHSFKKSGIVKRNQIELQKHGLVPYHRTREFRKKIAQLYVPILEAHAESVNGRFPVFKLAKNVFDHINQKKPGSSGSSIVRPSKQKTMPVTYAVNAQSVVAKHLQSGPRKNVIPAKMNT